MTENSGMDAKGSAGLTIKKLVTGMAVFGILLIVASPLVAHFSSGYRFRAAVREVANDLQFARVLALKQNKEIQVVFNSSSQTITVSSPKETKNILVGSRGRVKLG